MATDMKKAACLMQAAHGMVGHFPYLIEHEIPVYSHNKEMAKRAEMFGVPTIRLGFKQIVEALKDTAIEILIMDDLLYTDLQFEGINSLTVSILNVGHGVAANKFYWLTKHVKQIVQFKKAARLAYGPIDDAWVKRFSDKCSILAGNPKMDKVFNKTIDSGAMQKKYGLDLDKNKKTVLYAPSFFDKTLKTHYESSLPLWAEDMQKIIFDNPDFNWIVKLSPTSLEWNQAGSADLFKPWLIDSIDITEVMAMADLCITDFSACAYEWMGFGKPLIFLNANKNSRKAMAGIVQFNYGHICDNPMYLQFRLDDFKIGRLGVVPGVEKVLTECFSFQGNALERFDEILRAI